ncbi:TIGR03826 family flagellar region protein [Indiicoccus explosivorum]|uniref:TIGR03826 family flagellar region protein n=1 Tax=Indiicoccus explosivorum TaxID=1917864 RepID=UPI000B44BED7|nr:TIGR03826 family flagellar region protein [Indiicoccus explosivorum]
MGEVRDCPTCGSLFSYSGLREVCGPCATAEEKKYDEVYAFLRRRENRAATIERIVEVTGADPGLLHKWVKKGRIQTALFPNLGYPCDQCGRLTVEGKLCGDCRDELENGLELFEAAKDFRQRIADSEKGTYHRGHN